MEKGGARHAGDLVIADMCGHGMTVKHGHGVRFGTNEQTGQPSFITEAVKKRIDNQVPIFAAESRISAKVENACRFCAWVVTTPLGAGCARGEQNVREFVAADVARADLKATAALL